MGSDGSLEAAREAYERQAWSTARSTYAALSQEVPLALDDIDRYATAAHLAGAQAEARDALNLGHRQALALGDAIAAARFAFWLGHSMIFTGEEAQASGWFARARSLLSERGADCVEWGYLMILSGVEQLMAGQADAACRTFTESQAIGRRFADSSLVAMAGHGRGRALIRLGLTDEGMAVLDEVMVAVMSNEVTPVVVGEIYCGVLEACHDVFDLRRAREWTAALSRWCEIQPDLVPYRGPCLVHRVELMRLRGDWQDALAEAQRACEWLSSPTSPEGAADAFYELGDLYRLLGNVVDSEEAYRQASRLGRSPEPGLTLLWLDSGRAEAAATAVQRTLDEAGTEPWKRAQLLSACVEIQLRLNNVGLAQKASGELLDLAAALPALPLLALADRAEGSVLIAAAQPREALGPLRRSWSAWKQLDAPYEMARVRVLIANACRALGDDESAAMELDAARWVFGQLGAVLDLARLDGADTPTLAPATSRGLTPREIEVLCLIAAGETNKAIAASLVISEHTVARHVQNMLQKLGFSSRSSLAAFAVEHGLARTPGGQN